MASATEKNDHLTLSSARSISGLSGNDTITGSSGNDTITGGGSEWAQYGLNEDFAGPYYKKFGDNDSISGGAGNDSLLAGPGFDTIDGGAGLDQINFGQKFLFYNIETGGGEIPKPAFTEYTATFINLVVDLAAGTYSGSFYGVFQPYPDQPPLATDFFPEVSGHIKNVEAVFGSNHDDTIYGSKNNDQIKPWGGDDVIDGRGGFDILSYNDPGTQGIVVDYANGRVFDSTGHTDIFTGIEQVIGTQFADDFMGAAEQQIFTGGNGDDTFNGADGIDIVDYHLEAGTHGINIDLNPEDEDESGIDTYGATDHFISIEAVRGTIYNDIIVGAGEFWGDGGNDSLSAAGLRDTLHGGDGKDTLIGTIGFDSLMGDAGADSLEGGENNDTLHGGDGNDTLDGSAGADKLYGEDGNDTLTDTSLDSESGGAGKLENTVSGGDGNDTISGAGQLSGDDGDDAINGDGTLHGGDGDDRLSGTGNLYGDKGDDHLTMYDSTEDLGADGFAIFHLIGGAGKDTLTSKLAADSEAVAAADYSYASKGLTVSLSAQKVTVSSSDVDHLVGITDLIGTKYHDVFTGTSAANFLDGGAGNDSISAGGGKDFVVGDEGADTLRGGDGNDHIVGGGDNDVIYGDAGSDILEGESGNDVIHSGSGADILDGSSGSDKLYADGGTPTLRGGSGNDTFYFSNGTKATADGSGTGSDKFVLSTSAKFVEIQSFDLAHAKIDLSAFHIKSFTALKAMEHDISDLGSGTVFVLPHGVELDIDGVQLASLHASNFIL